MLRRTLVINCKPCLLYTSLTGATPAKAVPIHLHRQQRFQHRPERFRNPKTRGRPVVRRAGTRSLGARFFVHLPILPVIRIGSK